MNCSVVIVNWNTKQLLAQCIESLPDVEIIIVDNASTDGSDALKGKVDRWIQNSSNVGMARGLNQGITAATGDVVLCLHPDTVVKKGCIHSILATMTRTQASVVGPRMEYPDGTVFLNTHHFPTIINLLGEGIRILRFFGWPSVYMRSFHHAAETDVDIVASAGIFIRRSLWKSMGGFDEDFTNWMAEWEFCYRVKLGGGRVLFDPSGTIVHYENQSPNVAGEMQYKKYSHHIAHKMLEALFLFYEKCYGKKALGRIRFFSYVQFTLKWMMASLKGQKERAKNYTKVLKFVKA